jgi:hypothetical protein
MKYHGYLVGSQQAYPTRSDDLSHVEMAEVTPIQNTSPKQALTGLPRLHSLAAWPQNRQKNCRC